jgi:periplasmic divalent cation tolerance protein
MLEYVIAITTCPTDKSKNLALSLVDKRVCACVNIIPKITSIYHWKDKIVVDEESLLIMKTEKDRKNALWNAIKEKHPYEIPEYVILPITGGSQEYLNWISSTIETSD